MVAAEQPREGDAAALTARERAEARLPVEVAEQTGDVARLGRPALRVRVSALGSAAPILGAVRLAIDTLVTSTEREAS